MKNTSRIRYYNKINSPISQDKPLAQLGQIAKALSLAENELKALELLCKWESAAPSAYCKTIVMDRLVAALDDMQRLALDNSRPDEQAWARQFLPAVAGCFPPAFNNPARAIPGRVKP